MSKEEEADFNRRVAALNEDSPLADFDDIRRLIHKSAMDRLWELEVEWEAEFLRRQAEWDKQREEK